MSRRTSVLLALACVTIGQGAHAQTGDAGFTCEPGDTQAQRTVTATVALTGDGSVSDILSTVYDTQVRRGTAAQPASEAECRALVSARTSAERSSLADTHVVLYRIEASGGQTHVFAAYAALIPSDDPDVVTVGWDLVYVFDAEYTLLFYTLAAGPDAF